MIHEGPEPLSVVVEFLAHAHEPAIAAERAALQQVVGRLAKRAHQGPTRWPVDVARLVGPPVLAHQFHLPPQIVSQPFDLAVGMIDQRLSVSLQVSPAPLASLGLPVHLGSVAMDDAAERIAQQFG